MTDRKTAYGKREQRRADTQKFVGAGARVLGTTMRMGGIVGLTSGEPMSMGIGFGAYVTGSHIDQTGSRMRVEGTRRASKAAAVEGLISRARGGSAALGQHGLVPHGPEFTPSRGKQTNADRMRSGAMHLNGPKPTSGPSPAPAPVPTPAPASKFRYKGRQLGTAYGEREHQKARQQRRFSYVETGLGLTQMAIGAGVTGMGISIADPFMTLAGTGIMSNASLGGDRRKRATDRAAHATAVESLIAKSRGGSVALGMKGVVPKKQSNADRMRSGAMHLDGPKPATDYRTGKGVPGPDGISPMARELSRDPQAMQDAMQSVFANNPDLKAQLDKEAAGGNVMSKRIIDGSFPKGEADIQRSFDAIHKGSGGKSNGMGQVWKGPGEPPSVGPGASAKGNSGFNAANARFSRSQKAAKAQAPQQDGGTGKRRGWSDAARIEAAKAKGYQNLPYGGTPQNDDGMGQ